LTSCLAVEGWVDEVASGRPYADKAHALAWAGRSAEHLSDDELATALTRHPRIGEASQADDVEAAHSRREQSSVSTDGEAISALREGNVAYEHKFGRVFLIRAVGRSAEDVLSELRRRISNDDDTERAETVAQLREIALLRLSTALDPTPDAALEGGRA
nr:2-oxo-4-hydroxy-4-carboxy-5-ureidoimidazoline decarboxylase [Nocardioidaceae bacterium]